MGKTLDALIYGTGVKHLTKDTLDGIARNYHSIKNKITRKSRYKNVLRSAGVGTAIGAGSGLLKSLMTPPELRNTKKDVFLGAAIGGVAGGSKRYINDKLDARKKLSKILKFNDKAGQYAGALTGINKYFKKNK